MKYLVYILIILLTSCKLSSEEKNIPTTKVKEIKIVEKKSVETTETNPIPTKYSSSLRPDMQVLFNKTYIDTIVFNDYNDDFDYWYLNGHKNGQAVSLVYNWEWRTNDDYNFRQGDLITVQWKLDNITIAGDEEIVDIVERAIDAKRITSANQPIKFLKRGNRYDEGIKDTISTMVINQSYLYNITPPEKAALAFITYDIGNECEWGYDSEGNGRVLWCKILSALNLNHQCSDTQLKFLRKWFSKDTIALNKLKSCRTMPNTATVQTAFDEILILNNESKKTITVNFKVTGINMRESKSWQWSQTDVFEYGEDYIVLVDSKKSKIVEDDIAINPDKPDDLNNQKYVLSLKDYLVEQRNNNGDLEAQKVTFVDNVLTFKGKEGFSLRSYDLNNLIINEDEKSGKTNITIYNIGGGGGGNVVVAENYVLTVLDSINYHIQKGKTKLMN